METQTARRRVEMIAAHFSAPNNISATAVATHVFPVNCSSGLTSIKRRYHNRLNFARQDSRSQGTFMQQASQEQDCNGESSMPTKSTKAGPTELATPMFSQPANINSNIPKVREIQYVPSPQPPKFARTTIETDVPMQFSPKFLGIERKQSPRMDVSESGRKYILLIELPGVGIDDIRIEVNNTNLIVQTTKGKALSDCTYHKREIEKGPFEIMWPLPFDVNPDSVSAEFLDGLLRISIPKLRVPVW